MLQKIRDRASGWFAWTILILVSVPFALWGVNQYFDSGPQVSVADINDYSISHDDWQRAYQQERSRLQELLGANFDPQRIDEGGLKDDVLNRLIDTRVMEEAVDEYDMHMSDAQLAARIHELPYFQESNKFSPERYQSYLTSQGMTPADFEARFRQSLLLSQLEMGITQTMPITERHIDAAISLRDQRRDIAYVILPLEQMLSGIQVSAEQAARYYKTHSKRYIDPERVVLDYVELKAADMTAQFTPKEEELRAVYADQMQGQAVTQEQRRASQIVVYVPKDAPAAAVTKAQAKVQVIQNRLSKGEAFDKVAKEMSDDAGTAAEGGDMGFFAKGSKDPAIENALFSMQVDEISKPLRTPLGFHVVKLTAIKPKSGKTFAEMRPELEQEYRRHSAETRFFELADQLSDVAFENPESLEPAAKALQLQVQRSPWITRAGGSGIGAHPRVVEAAFSPDVMEEGNNSEPIEIEPTHVVVVRVKERRAARLPPLAEIREKVTADVRRHLAQEKVQAIGQQLLKRLNKGETMAALAQERKLTIQREAGIARTADKVPAPIVEAAFKLKRPDKNQSSYTSVELPSGDYALVALSAVHDGAAPSLTKDQRASYRNELANNYGQNQIEAMVDALRKQADVKIHTEQKDL